MKRTHCKHGHPQTAENVYRNGRCRECYRADYQAHREERLAKNRIWRLANIEKHRARARAYYRAHREERRAAGAAYYATHLEERCAASRAYRKKNLEKVRADSRAYYAAHSEELRRKPAAKQLEDRRQAQRDYYKAHPEEMRAFKEAYLAEYLTCASRCKVCGELKLQFATKGICRKCALLLRKSGKRQRSA